VRTTYNRQARRAARCFRPSTPRRGRALAFSPRRLALTGDGDNLAAVAAILADALELSDELIDLLPATRFARPMRAQAEAPPLTT
jgi:hypothetical protein